MEEVERVTTVSRDEPAHVVQTTRTKAPGIQTEHPQKAYEKKKTIFRAYQIIWYVLGVIEVLLTFRVILKMLGANSSSGFVNIIYALSNPLATPFRGIFNITAVTPGAYFEWSTLVAMIVYLIVAYGLVQLMQIVKPTNPQEVDRKVENV